MMVTISINWRAVLSDAVRMVTYHHAGQKDLAGKPYAEHVFRVAGKVELPQEKVVALLHDILEDTDVTEELLRRLFPEEIADAVKLLTRYEDESYSTYISRVADHPIARRVKIADLKDNLDPTRLRIERQVDRDRVAKYRKALARLEMLE